MMLLMALVAMTSFSQQMTVEEEKETGVYYLTPLQRGALENWIEKHCRLHCANQKESPNKTLSLYTNLDGGRRLELSDGNIYEVSPEDLNISASWVTPFPLKIEMSHDPDYPLLIVNTYTGRSVRVRKL